MIRFLLNLFLPFYVFLLITGSPSSLYSQEKIGFLEFSKEFNKRRFTTATIGGGVIYLTGVTIVSRSWYSNYERTKFHTFNDWGEWNDMDKAGHLFTAWMYSQFAYKGARWTGLNKKKSAITAASIGFGLQATLEIMDAYSAKWGFSYGDIAFNSIGSLIFLGQELAWEEQRIIFKMSSKYKNYSNQNILSTNGNAYSSLEDRANDLYGASHPARFIKDYNAQTIWASINISSFIQKNNNFPKWINLAIGYSAENMFGGFENSWTEKGNLFVIKDENIFRYRQFIISPDIDLTRINTNKKWLKTSLKILNIFKIPSPAMEINTLGKLKFHALYF